MREASTDISTVHRSLLCSARPPVVSPAPHSSHLQCSSLDRFLLRVGVESITAPCTAWLMIRRCLSFVRGRIDSSRSHRRCPRRLHCLPPRRSLYPVLLETSRIIGTISLTSATIPLLDLSLSRPLDLPFHLKTPRVECVHGLRAIDEVHIPKHSPRPFSSTVAPRSLSEARCGSHSELRHLFNESTRRGRRIRREAVESPSNAPERLTPARETRGPVVLHPRGLSRS